MTRRAEPEQEVPQGHALLPDGLPLQGAIPRGRGRDLHPARAEEQDPHQGAATEGECDPAAAFSLGAEYIVRQLLTRSFHFQRQFGVGGSRSFFFAS